MEEEKVGKVKSNNDGKRRADWFKLHLPGVSLRQDWKKRMDIRKGDADLLM